VICTFIVIFYLTDDVTYCHQRAHVKALQHSLTSRVNWWMGSVVLSRGLSECCELPSKLGCCWSGDGKCIWPV